MSVTCLRFANVYGPHIDCLRKQPPFIGYMIRELYYNRVPTFYSDGNQSRDYIFVEDLLDLALIVRDSEGFEILNVSSEKSYSVKELYEITSSIMGRIHIIPKYEGAIKFWGKYPELYEGNFKISEDILNHEVNKFTLCSNKLAKNKYGWEPKISMHEGLQKSVKYITKMFDNLEKREK